MNDVHLERVEPGKAPGGIWVRVCTDSGKLLAEQAVIRPTLAEISALSACATARPELESGDTVRFYVYDGDTGVCTKTLIAYGKELDEQDL